MTAEIFLKQVVLGKKKKGHRESGLVYLTLFSASRGDTLRGGRADESMGCQERALVSKAQTQEQP